MFRKVNLPTKIDSFKNLKFKTGEKTTKSTEKVERSLKKFKNNFKLKIFQ